MWGCHSGECELLPSLMWKMQAGCSYRTMMAGYKTIQHFIPEDWSSVDGLIVSIMYHTFALKSLISDYFVLLLVYLCYSACWTWTSWALCILPKLSYHVWKEEARAGLWLLHLKLPCWGYMAIQHTAVRSLPCVVLPNLCTWR